MPFVLALNNYHLLLIGFDYWLLTKKVQFWLSTTCLKFRVTPAFTNGLNFFFFTIQMCDHQMQIVIFFCCCPSCDSVSTTTRQPVTVNNTFWSIISVSSWCFLFDKLQSNFSCFFIHSFFLKNHYCCFVYCVNSDNNNSKKKKWNWKM